MSRQEGRERCTRVFWKLVADEGSVSVIRDRKRHRSRERSERDRYESRGSDRGGGDDRYDRERRHRDRSRERYVNWDCRSHTTSLRADMDLVSIAVMQEPTR